MGWGGGALGFGLGGGHLSLVCERYWGAGKRLGGMGLEGWVCEGLWGRKAFGETLGGGGVSWGGGEALVAFPGGRCRGEGVRWDPEGRASRKAFGGDGGLSGARELRRALC